MGTDNQAEDREDAAIIAAKVAARAEMSASFKIATVALAAGNALRDFVEGRNFTMIAHAEEAVMPALEFGRANGWPPAEAFARQAARDQGEKFDTARWGEDAVFRARFEIQRAVLMAGETILADFAASRSVRATPMPKRAADAGFDRVAGHGDRNRIDPPKAKGKPMSQTAPSRTLATTPLSQVKGIGEAIEKRLHAVGIQSAEAFIKLNEGQWRTLEAKDPQLLALIENRRLVKAAAEHLKAEAAKRA